jgi:peptide chain release factor subunit 1
MRLATKERMQEKTTTALATPLQDQLNRLAAFDPTDLPVLSLYLDLRANNEGKDRDQYEPFLRKAFTERMQTLKGDARKSFESDVERINAHLATVPASANGVAIFACAGRDYFESIQLDAPLGDHWLFVGSVPHIYPLARLNDQHPRYAAVLLDTNSARIFVFGLGATEARESVSNVKTRRTMMGGWSQARYQRHIENFHLHHIKEVVDLLDRVVREERINQIVVACDEVARPTLFEQMPKHLAEKVIDIVKLDIRSPEHQILTETLEALRSKDQETDAERVQRMLDAWRAHGLGVAGPEATLDALLLGEVEELLITATPERLAQASLPHDFITPGTLDVNTSASNAALPSDSFKLADELVTKAQQQSARIRFIEDPSLLEDVGGIGALLRFRIRPTERS